MSAVVHIPPNHSAAEAAYGVPKRPIQTLAINNQPFEPQLNGIIQIVYSYGGAMLFVEFMAEMRRVGHVVFMHLTTYLRGLGSSRCEWFECVLV
ncbi:hypothetical protein PAXINDRAFT_8183 [Paxillus involutus ATCC 200175]|nr:hypothetical protein PAXINDRAFT_8183 [Paxillus involutus ATCC 200175]